MTTCNPLISIIIPVYNVEQYLGKCLDSVLAQTYKNLEIILVDDGSTDNSGTICDEYKKKDRRIRVIHQINQGVSAARNAGLNIATGSYIGFVDGDDWLELDMYEYLLNLCFLYETEVSVCEFAYQELEYKPLYPKDCCMRTRSWLANRYSSPAVWNKLFARSLIGDIRFNTQVAMGEDSLFCTLVLSRTLNIAYGKEIKYNYFTNNNGATKSSLSPAKLTSFIVFPIEIECATKHRWLDVVKCFEMKETNEAAGYLGQMIQINYKDPNSKKYLLSIIRKRKWTFLLSNYKLFTRLFVLIASYNFEIASILYRVLKNNKK